MGTEEFQNRQGAYGNFIYKCSFDSIEKDSQEPFCEASDSSIFFACQVSLGLTKIALEPFDSEHERWYVKIGVSNIDFLIGLLGARSY